MRPGDFDTVSTASRTIHDLRPLGFWEVPVVGRYRYVSSSPPLDVQTQPGYLEVCFLVTGEQDYRVESELVHLRGGQFLVVQAGESFSTGAEPEKRGELIWMFLSVGDELPLLGFTRGESETIERTLRRAARVPYLASPRLIALAERLFEAPRGSSELLAAGLRTTLMDLLINLCEAIWQGPRPEQVSPEIQRAVELLQDRPNESIDLARLASVAGLSVSRFKERFRNEVGSTPMAYTTELRVRRAKELLSHGGADVTRIAYDLGFSSAQYFSFVFRKYTGMTPTQYRDRADH